MSYRHQTPVPESNLNVPPLSSPLTPGNAARQASIEKVQTWTGAMTLLQDRLLESANILVKLGSLRDGERGFEDQGGRLRKLVELKDLQDNLDQMVIQAKSLSKTRRKDLDSLGVTEQERSITVHALEDGLYEVLLEEETAQYSDEADMMSEKVLEHFMMWSGVLNTHTEAASRMFINDCILHSIPLAEGFKFGRNGKGRIFVCPEQSISRPRKDAEDIDDGPIRNLVETTGRIDYVMIYVPDWHSLGPDEQRATEDYFKRLSKIPVSGIDVPGNPELRFMEICLSVIEAKRLPSDTDHHVLLDALPQAIAEALVLGHRFGITDDEHRIIPFVLTDGAQWIWGLLEPHASDGVPERWTCFRSEPHEIQLEHAALKAVGSARQEIMRNIRRLMDVMVYWNCAQRHQILEIVRKAP
ncbi:hypothetical protein FRC04_004001 [Tulasnella sp. 424]|nr:hypothetical protein FRC04_004001 [Tulasnella sp. 424]KAG8970598.1 hypothetical protein FRC05_000534 [Tulasnella sp. 425]